jgi:cytochrome c oxidase cbb3-type subunit 4
MSMEANAMESASQIDMGVIRGVIAALTMAVFLGITWWAYRRGNRERFEDDALMPFVDDDTLPAGPERGEGGR